MTSWDGVRYRDGDHVESYFVKATSQDAARALWIRATIFARAGEEAIAEGWAVAFDRRPGRSHVAVKQTLPYRDARFASDALDIRWSWSTGSGSGSDFEMCGERTRGSIARFDHTIAWDLRITGTERPFFLVPEKLYGARFPRSKTVTPLPDARLDGELEVDGERLRIDAWRGMRGHNWGQGNAELYAWFHCNQWEGGEDVVVEAVCARLRIGPILAPPITSVVMRANGTDHSFTRMGDLALNRGTIRQRSFQFAAEASRAGVEGRIDAALEDFVGLYYPNPKGPVTHCLNAKLARAELRVRLGERRLELRSRAAALEIGTHRSDHGVTMYV